MGSVHIELHAALVAGIGTGREAFLHIDLPVQLPGVIQGHVLEKRLDHDPSRRGVVRGAFQTIEIVGVVGSGGVGAAGDTVGERDVGRVRNASGELALQVSAPEQHLAVPRTRIGIGQIRDHGSGNIAKSAELTKVGHGGRFGGVDGDGRAVDPSIVDGRKDSRQEHGGEDSNNGQNADHFDERESGAS